MRHDEKSHDAPPSATPPNDATANNGDGCDDGTSRNDNDGGGAPSSESITTPINGDDDDDASPVVVVDLTTTSPAAAPKSKTNGGTLSSSTTGNDDVVVVDLTAAAAAPPDNDEVQNTESSKESIIENDVSNEKDDDEDDWRDADFLSFDAPDGGGGNATTPGSENDNNAPPSSDSEIKNGRSPKNARRGNSNNNGNNTTDRDSSTNSDGFQIPCVSQHTQSLAPWMLNRPHDQYTPGLIRLHNEIVDFTALVSPRPHEIKAREDFVEKLRGLAEETFGVGRCEVIVFGSQSTNTYLPDSDIDIVIKLSKDEPNPDTDVDSSPPASPTHPSPLITLGTAIKHAWKDSLSYLEVVENTRVPIIKLTHEHPTKLSVDICFDQESGPKCAAIMKKFLSNYPPLRALCLVLKYFTKIRGVNEPYFGGIGSFTLQMLIVSFLQHRGREEYNTRGRTLGMNLGGMLLEFFELYGLDFNYVTTGISVREDGCYFSKGERTRREDYWQPSRPFSIAVENPCEITSDVGRSTYRMGRIQKSFDVAFRLLLLHVSDGEPKLKGVKSILACVLPPNEELWERAASMGDKGGGGNKLVDSGSDMVTSEDDEEAYRYGSGRGSGDGSVEDRERGKRRRSEEDYEESRYGFESKRARRQRSF
mmetsp:Transcript_30036/g.36633  ORF Transcript_30036/g.36633 Transcript_30036/m.36633 type:complete len:648 (-) Transcript_30036:48-1991(-)|eukprot:CAMPEP_0172487754 /NCGR_PEP_ID=MMETSP1066-20121228/16971_1 /TAXON_ID=671091 /ORGANISM="Coscinodiscus wailesii, Strain CCMP2513" /LENGTH=647 /DNA_ID=CAMNT_0013254563 /DNA_START=256 /DNA_END=2199 /DNA_ORIENTATION=+